MDDQSILTAYQELPFFGDEPLDGPIGCVCRLSNDDELSHLIRTYTAFDIFIIRPRHHFYVIERIEIKNNPKQISTLNNK